MKNTAILMVVHERANFVARSAKAVSMYNPDADFLVWDNDSKKAEVIAALDELDQLSIPVYRHDSNVGLDKAQQLFQQQQFNAGKEFVVCLEDGCLVLPWTIQTLVETMREYPEIGLAACSLTAGPAQQLLDLSLVTCEGIDTWLNERMENAGQEREKDQPKLPDYPVVWNAITEPDPFLWILRRECWEEVGPLDAEFWQGWGTLLDYSFRAREKGWMAATIWDATAITWDRHVVRDWIDSTAERNTWMGRGINRMRDKYGGVDSWERCIKNFEEYVVVR